ncbi:hypothetical protein D9M69_599210 [compost metagenome]
MEHRPRPAEAAFAQQGQEIALVQVVGYLGVGEVAELVALGQIIDGDQVGLAPRIEGLDQVAADEAGGTGNDDAHG